MALRSTGAGGNMQLSSIGISGGTRTCLLCADGWMSFLLREASGS